MTVPTSSPRLRRERRSPRARREHRGATGFVQSTGARPSRPSDRQLVGLALLGVVLAALGAQVAGFGATVFEDRWLARAEIQYRGTAWTETQDVAVRSRSLVGPVAQELGISIKDFEERLDARLLSGTQIVRVDYLDTDPDLARAVVDAVSARYINEVSELTPVDVRSALEAEQEEIRLELADEEARFSRLSTSTREADRPAQQASQSIINSLRARLDDVQSRILDHDLATIDEAQNGVPILVTEPFVFEERVFPRPKLFAAIGGASGLAVGALIALLFWNRTTWHDRPTRGLPTT